MIKYQELSDFEKKLGQKYIFMNRETILKICPSSIYARYGLEINKGWFAILENVCKKISEILTKYSLPQDAFILLQCKQKFGKLKIYWELSEECSASIRNEIKTVIRESYEQASKTCEFCGIKNESVELRQDSWVYTLCDDCYQKRLQKIAESKKTK